MRGDTHLSEVIGAIYDATVDAHAWPAALRAACNYVDGQSAHIWLQDCGNQGWQIPYAHGLGEGYLKLGLELTMVQSNPMSRLAWAFGIGHVQVGSALLPKAGMTERQYHATRFYQEWHQPQGLADAVHATLDKTGTALTRVTFALGGPPGRRLDDRIPERVKLLVPHFRRAVHISNLLKSCDNRAAGCSSALDELATGVLLMNEAGSLVYANRAAEQLLLAGVLVSDRHGALAMRDPAANAQLQRALGAPDRGSPDSGRSIVLQGAGGERYIGHVMPLDSAKRQKLDTSSSAAMALFLRRAELCARISGQVLAALYDLTPMEARVLLAVVDFAGVHEVAQVLHLSEATVRTHLRHVFSKTNTHRQADLVKLVASYSSPLAI